MEKKKTIGFILELLFLEDKNLETKARQEKHKESITAAYEYMRSI